MGTVDMQSIVSMSRVSTRVVADTIRFLRSSIGTNDKSLSRVFIVSLFNRLHWAILLG